ncbi:ATP-binding protein [Actinoplanes sp. NPDC023801]|uniref:ATP-binding protein n=1 Tax=Actinoplanes sp. NPDC023801 TaxID=3154595 RepID=UPI003411D6D5
MADRDTELLKSPSRLQAVAGTRRGQPTMPVPLDAVARMAAHLVQAPMAVVSLAEPEEEFLGSYGLTESLTARRGTGKHLVYANVAGADAPLAVPDMAADAEFAEHPMLTSHGIRAFAGVPLRDEHARQVGALTVLDDKPHTWTENDLSTLVEITEMLGPLPSGTDPATAMTTLTGLHHGDTGQDDSTASVAVSPTVQAGVQAGFITALLDSLQVGVFAVDAHQRPVLFNRALRHFFRLPDHLTPAEAVAGGHHQVRHPDGRPYTTDELSTVRALKGHSIRDVEAILRIPGLPDRHMLTNAEPIRDADGQLLGAVAAIHDVTERRRRERWRDCELHVAKILNGSGTITEAAPPILQTAGQTLGHQHLELLLADDVADVLRLSAYWSAPGVNIDDLIPQTISRGDAGPGYVWDTGQPLWLPDLTNSEFAVTEQARAFAHAAAQRGLHASLAVPVPDGDTILGVLMSLSSTAEYDASHTWLLDSVAAQLGHFLTHRRNTELQQQLAHAKDDFLTLVSHEMRTPLTSIISYSTLLAEEIIDPELVPVAAAITRNTGILQSIIDDLLDLAGLEWGHTTLQLRPTHLRDVVDAAIVAMPPDARPRVHIDMPSTLILDADPHRLRQIIDQLLSNAIKYSPDSGDIHIHAHDNASGVIELTITDSGIGIPAEDREQLFTRFHRASNARHTAIGGTGLGLALVRALVHTHGGTITHDPDRQPGTRIIVRLPQHHSTI